VPHRRRRHNFFHVCEINSFIHAYSFFKKNWNSEI
jgi:hypothetical protein